MKISQLIPAFLVTAVFAEDTCVPVSTVTVYNQNPPAPKIETITITVRPPAPNNAGQNGQNNGNFPQQGGVVTVTVEKIVTHTATVIVTHTPPPVTVTQHVQKPVGSAAPTTNNNGNVFTIETTVIVDQNGNILTLRPDLEPTPKPQPNSQPTNNNGGTAVPAPDKDKENTASPNTVSSHFNFSNHTTNPIPNGFVSATANPVETITSLYTFVSSGSQHVITTVVTRTPTTGISIPIKSNTDSIKNDSRTNTPLVGTSSSSPSRPNVSIAPTASGSNALTTLTTSSSHSTLPTETFSTVDTTLTVILSATSTVESSSDSNSVFFATASSSSVIEPNSSSADYISSATENTSPTVEPTSSIAESTFSSETTFVAESTSAAEPISTDESTPAAETTFTAESTSSITSINPVESTAPPDDSTTIETPSSTASTTDSSPTDPLNANSQFAIDVVSNHNRLRALHGVPDMTWNRDLAEFAQNYLAQAQCKFEHSGGPYGENLAIGYPTTADSIQAWYDEIKDYDFSKGEFSSATGHFTQVVWKDSTEIGCAEVDCGSPWGGPYIVCEYYPRGNIIGWFQENVFPPLAG